MNNDLFGVTASEIQKSRGNPKMLACIDSKGRSERTMQRKCQSGEIPCFKDENGNYCIPDSVIASKAKEAKRLAEMKLRMCDNIEKMVNG